MIIIGAVAGFCIFLCLGKFSYPATSVWGLKLLVHGALNYHCMRPYATSVLGLELLVYEALSN
jgi:hypothetical protein